MARFYLDDNVFIGQTLDLPLNIVKHMQVLRLKNNDIVSFFNGKGSECLAKLLILDRKTAKVEILGKTEFNTAVANQISLAISVIANDKMDLVIQKATELGVREITPIYSQYSQRIAQDRLNSRLEHWQQIIINSCCQCRQNLLPTINKPIDFKQLMEIDTNFNLKIILSLTSHNNTTHAVQPPINSLLLVGPEGGFTESEQSMAVDNGYHPLQLGNLVLRSETAVIAGLSLLNSQLNIW